MGYSLGILGSGEWGVGSGGDEGDGGDKGEFLNKFLPCLFPMPNAPCPIIKCKS
ncbi:MAG: hypothetical protein V7L05_03835 [Nostoc sp.]|uniref:hypothetical protein n=1 Tax=Nostoc sp. TaxID=1180 RepID=UPI002FF4E9A7